MLIKIKFNISYTSKEALKKKFIYYYYKYHRTTINCDAKILYIISEPNYYWLNVLSEKRIKLSSFPLYNKYYLDKKYQIKSYYKIF